MSFKDRLKGARKRAGLTQAELAEKTGLSTGTIQMYERGKRNPSVKALPKIAKALNLGCSYAENGEVYFYDFADVVESPEYKENEEFNRKQYEDAIATAIIADEQAFPYESLDLKYVPDEVMRDLLAVQYETTEDTITENDIKEAKKRAARDPIFLKELFKGRLGTAAAIEMTNREIRVREQLFAEDRENREKIRNEMDIADYVILEFFHLLNDNGKDKLVDYAADLVKIEEYLEKKEE